MNKLPAVFLLALLLGFALPAHSADEPRHLMVAKFTLARLQQADLTEAQTAEFNKLSATLRKEIDALRKEAGISKQVMVLRDTAHRELKGQKLEDAEYWKRLASKAKLNKAQLDAFKHTTERYEKFKADAMKLLTDEQRAKLKRKAASEKKAESAQRFTLPMRHIHLLGKACCGLEPLP